MDLDSSFYLTVSSSADSEFFPDNAVSHFKNKTPSPIDLNDRWEVVVTQSDKGFQQVSFVNSIATTKVCCLPFFHSTS